MAVKIGAPVATLIAVALAAVYLSSGQGVGRPAREDREEKIVLKVTFDPDRRREGIPVVATVEGVPIFDSRVYRPWEKTEWVPRGAKVSLRAWQESYGTLTCQISSGGAPVSGPVTTNQTPGDVACEYRSR